MRLESLKFAIIGVGQVGSFLANAINANKLAISGFFDVDSEKSVVLQKRLMCGTIFSDVDTLLSESSFVFITTPDDRIKDVVTVIDSLSQDLTGKFFSHSSGLLSSDVLGPLKAHGAKVLSFHPCVSVTAISDFSGAAIALEGDREALKVAEELVALFACYPVHLSKELKGLYHFGAAAVSNFLITIFNRIMDLYTESGLPLYEAEKILIPLLESTLSNIKREGVSRSLTGPIARGDVETVRKHCQIVQSLDTKTAGCFRLLMQMTVEMAKKHGYVTRETRDSLLEVLEDVSLQEE